MCLMLVALALKKVRFTSGFCFPSDGVGIACRAGYRSVSHGGGDPLFEMILHAAPRFWIQTLVLVKWAISREGMLSLKLTAGLLRPVVEFMLCFLIVVSCGHRSSFFRVTASTSILRGGDSSSDFGDPRRSNSSSRPTQSSTRTVGLRACAAAAYFPSLISTTGILK